MFENNKNECGKDGCQVHIKGIICNVGDCIYHTKENRCLAGEIAIGPTDAKTSDDTLCVTFRPKSEG